MPDAATDKRAELLATIEYRRACIEAYVREKTPASGRLSTISIVSSAIAAALTAGPALGGERFTAAAQDGLSLEKASTVWRLLCFAALVVSVTAAIAANLAKANDLTSRIASAEAAGAMLHGVHTRLRFAGLSLEDAAQEYRDIVTGIPFVPELPTSDREGAGQVTRTGSRGPRLGQVLVITAAALAAALLVVILVGFLIGDGQATDSGPAAPTTAAAPSTVAPPSSDGSADPSPSPTPEVGPVGVFAGGADGLNATLAIVVEGEQASAYLCDGVELEAWLSGPVIDGRIDLTSPGGATLSGTVGDRVVSGEVVVDGRSTAFRADLASEPAGVYEADIQVNGEPARVGWAVLSTGEQAGVVNRGGVRTRAPLLDTEALVFEYQGEMHEAERRGG